MCPNRQQDLSVRLELTGDGLDWLRAVWTCSLPKASVERLPGKGFDFSLDLASALSSRDENSVLVFEICCPMLAVIMARAGLV